MQANCSTHRILLRILPGIFTDFVDLQTETGIRVGSPCTATPWLIPTAKQACATTRQHVL